MKQRLTHLGTTPSGKKVFLEKAPHEYPSYSKADHLYAAVIHEANRTRGGEVARLHRLAAGADRRPARSHATKADFDWNAFTDGAAYGFWASPYMSEAEALGEKSREAYRAVAPRPGGNWKTVLPKVPPAAYAVAKKFTKAVKDTFNDEQVDEIASKFSPYDAGFYGAMQSQGEGVGWHDEGVHLDAPEGFEYDPKLQNAIARDIARKVRAAGLKLPRGGY
jgi:hypothetical protein